jgi:CRISPR-associated protein Csx14
MGRAVIPVYLHNPGQVFACLGFLEAAEILCGPATGGFDWNENERFVLEAEGAENPVEAVLQFLANVTIYQLAPHGWVDPPKQKLKKTKIEEAETEENANAFKIADSFPAREGARMALPIHLGGGNWPIVQLGHWADGSSRNSFKLYAGNRSAAKIAADMLGLIREIWKSQRDSLLHKPLDTLCPMGGSFNFDPRGAWTAIDTGYSPDIHKVKGGNVLASPVVELMAAWGMEHARPNEYDVRQVRYAVWRSSLPPMLARAAVSGGLTTTISSRCFRFPLALSGKNKVICFAHEEPAP